MLSEGLQHALNCLKIQDVYFEKIDAQVFNRKLLSDKLKPTIQQKFGVKRLSQDKSAEQQFVFFTFEAGVRWTTSATSQAKDRQETADGDIIAQIECEVVACYQLQGDVSDEFLKEFAFKNSGLHVWPYWREFLSSTCGRLQLPKVVLPTVQFINEPASESRPKD